MSILWDVGDYLKIKEMGLPIIKTGTTNMGNGVYLLREGTPLNSSGAVANTGNAKYLVAEDFYFYSNKPDQAKLVKVIERGYVDLNKAEEASGLTFTNAAKSALATAGVILVDGALETGGGSDLPDVGAGDKKKFLHVSWATGELEWKRATVDLHTNDLEGGSFCFDDTAATVYGYLFDGVCCTFLSPTDDVGVLLGAKADMTEFYAMYNGSIITFEAESGDQYPTYTPTP